MLHLKKQAEAVESSLLSSMRTIGEFKGCSFRTDGTPRRKRPAMNVDVPPSKRQAIDTPIRRHLARTVANDTPSVAVSEVKVKVYC